MKAIAIALILSVCIIAIAGGMIGIGKLMYEAMYRWPNASLVVAFLSLFGFLLFLVKASGG